MAVYVRKDVSVIRRTDLESGSVECLWLEVLVRKSHSFLVGTFYTGRQTLPLSMTINSWLKAVDHLQLLLLYTGIVY